MYRKIVTEFWSDPVVEQMSWAAKYVLLYLLTSPMGSMSGCYVITAKRIAKDTELDIDAACSAFSEIIESGIAEYCESTKEVLLKNWPKYNWNSSPNMITALEKSINAIKHELFRDYLNEELKAVASKQQRSSSKAAVKQLRSDTVSVSVYKNEDTGCNSTSKNPHVETKHKHGSFDNVLLTDYELDQLKTRFPSDWQTRIDDLSYYIGSTGKKYKSHYRTILSWDRKNSAPQEVKVDARFAAYD